MIVDGTDMQLIDTVQRNDLLVVDEVKRGKEKNQDKIWLNEHDRKLKRIFSILRREGRMFIMCAVATQRNSY